jgi:hypothetical protein
MYESVIGISHEIQRPLNSYITCCEFNFFARYLEEKVSLSYSAKEGLSVALLHKSKEIAVAAPLDTRYTSAHFTEQCINSAPLCSGIKVARIAAIPQRKLPIAQSVASIAMQIAANPWDTLLMLNGMFR